MMLDVDADTLCAIGSKYRLECSEVLLGIHYCLCQVIYILKNKIVINLTNGV